MTSQTQSRIAKKQILAAKTSVLRSLNNEQALKYELTQFFENLKKEVLHELEEYYNDEFMFQAQADLILSPIFESHQKYYNILRKYNHKEYYFGRKTGRRLVKLAQKKAKKNTIQIADKSRAPSILSASINKDELFGTNPYVEQELLNKSFIASENTMNRVDKDINKILSDGYRNGQGIKQVRNDIIKRFDQLSSWEAQRIARTEIHNAHNMGTMSIYSDMGVQYTQWVSVTDNRTRDSHRKINGEIIPFGGTYSNDLRYPGDTSGKIKEWINCRCSNAPFIIPEGYIAPSFAPFREKDLIPTLDYWNQDELITQATQESSIIPKEEIIEELRTNDFDIYRLPSEQREYYIKLKKNHTILKEALETRNYSKLNDLDHSVTTLIESKESVKELGDEFLTLAKEELDDYAHEIKNYEKIIKDKNIKVTIEPKNIPWKNSKLKNYSIYNSKTGEYEPFNSDEKFIKYYFKKERLTIYESVDMDHSRVMHVYKEYKKLPKQLQNTKEIVLSSQQPVRTGLQGFDDVKLGGYVIKGKGNRIVEFKKTLIETMETIVHEATHNLEKDQLYYISNSKEYVLAFKKDQKRLLSLGKELKDTYVTDYSYGFTEAALDTNNIAHIKYGHRIYSEDLAESMKKYLRNKTKFAEDYPEKAKVLEKILKGKFNPKTTTPYKKWFQVESKRFKLTQKEMERNLELKLKQTDLSKQGKKLSSKELKELQFYEDKKTFDYLHNQKLMGESLDKVEEKRYNEISKKWKRKLGITDEILDEKTKYINHNFTKYTTRDNKHSIKIRQVTDKKEFMNYLKKAKESRPIFDGWRVEIPKKLARYDNCKMFVTEHGSTVAIDEHGDIISVCAYIPKGQKRSKDSSRALLEFAVKNGGTKLDSYDGNYGFYRRCGFYPISYCEFVEDFAPDDWKKWHTFNSREFKKEKIIFFKFAGKQSKYLKKEDFYEDVKPNKDYDTAERIRDKQLNRINKVISWLKNIL